MSQSELGAHHADIAHQEENLIVEKILTSAVETLGLSTRDITITHGRKELTVTFENAEPMRAYTFVKNKRGEEQVEPNETTLLYTAIQKVIQQEADRLGLPIIYTLTTTSPQMTLWATTKGRKLFDWGNEKTTQFETRDRLTCTKTFYPKIEPTSDSESL